MVKLQIDRQIDIYYIHDINRIDVIYETKKAITLVYLYL